MAQHTIFCRPESMTDATTHYCPGCTHGIIHRMVAESLDELGLREKACGVAPVGCSVLAYNYFNCDFLEAAHGRAPAFAVGLKRVSPEMTVFTYQGDGDLASIGTNEILHAANRGEKITVIFVNNAIYGMTGGQMAPTTLPGQITTTSPTGRDVNTAGWPIRMRELLSTLRTPAYIARGSSHSPQWVIRTKQYIKKAFEYQEANRCFSLIEVLSTCPTNWGMTPTESTKWLADNMIPYYPLGELKTPDEDDALVGKMLG
ncbi:2-oxoglutarate oxidoreductase [bacterium]|nr:2-oxoglutarate oxidoreductase [bacterium]